MAFHTSGADVVSGICTLHSAGKITSRHLTGVGSNALSFEELLEVERWLGGQFFYQPEVMFTRDLWERSGGKLNESLHYTMDCDLWLHFAQANARLHVIGQPICLFRVHDQQKTFSATDFRPELENLSRQYAKQTSKSPRPVNVAGLPRNSIRIVCFNDCGNQSAAGVALQRLAASMTLAGHDVVSLAAISAPGRSSLTSEQIIAALAERKPDLVVLGNLSGAQLDADLPQKIVQKWATVRLADPLNPAKADQLPLAIDPGFGLPTHILKPRDKTTCRDLLHLPQDRFIVLFVAQNLTDPARGLSKLIEAIATLKIPDVLLVTVGRYDTAPRSEGLEIRNVGFIADPQKLAMYYSAADLFVSPNSALPTCLEAAACGTPSITTAKSPAEPFIIQSSPQDLAATIRRLYDDPQYRQNLGAWARLWAENEFSLAVLYHRFFNQLKTIGLAEKLNLPLRIYFRPDETLPPALVYLEQNTAAPSQAAAEDPYGFLAAWDAERQSMRTAFYNVTQTRLWRMVDSIYPAYHRIAHSKRLPGFARRGIQSIGDWLSARPKITARNSPHYRPSPHYAIPPGDLLHVQPMCPSALPIPVEISLSHPIPLHELGAVPPRDLLSGCTRKLASNRSKINGGHLRAIRSHKS